MLNEDERTHWKSYRFDKHRHEYLMTRVLVRTALSHYHLLAPAEWRFELNRYGKPFIVPDCGLRFNLSNSPGLVVCLISRGSEVGVDAEPCSRASAIAELGCDLFSSLELTQLHALQGAERVDRALSLWTLKEAYIKARGVGLSLPLNQVSLLFGGPEGIRLELDSCLEDKAERWRFCLLDHADHRIAVMAHGAAAFDLQVIEMRPSLPVSSARLTDAQEQWYPLNTR